MTEYADRIKSFISENVTLEALEMTATEWWMTMDSQLRESMGNDDFTFIDTWDDYAHEVAQTYAAEQKPLMQIIIDQTTWHANSKPLRDALGERFVGFAGMSVYVLEDTTIEAVKIINALGYTTDEDHLVREDFNRWFKVKDSDRPQDAV